MKTKSAKSINQCKSVIQTTHDIVKAHGGTMNIDSQPGQTIFTIKFNR